MSMVRLPSTVFAICISDCDILALIALNGLIAGESGYGRSEKRQRKEEHLAASKKFRNLRAQQPQLPTEFGLYMRLTGRAIAAAICLSFAVTALWSQTVLPPYNYGSQEMQAAAQRLEDGLLRLSMENVHTSYTHKDAPSQDRLALIAAMGEYASGSRRAAELSLASFIRLRPNSPLVPRAELMRGFFAFDTKDYLNSSKYFDAALEKSNTLFALKGDSTWVDVSAQALFWSGSSMLHLGKNDIARQRFQECTTRFPHHNLADDSYLQIGLIAEQNGDHNGAASIYAAMRRDYSKRNTVSNAALREAHNRLKLRQSSAALTALEQAETALRRFADEEDSDGYEKQTNAETAVEQMAYLRVEALNQLGQYEQSLERSESFLKKYPLSEYRDKVWLSSGWSLLAMGKASPALVYLRMVMDSLPDTGNPVRCIAQLYYGYGLKLDGRRDEASREFSALSVQNTCPYIAHSLLELAQLHYEDGRYSDARKALERAERESSEGVISVRIQLLLGACYLEERNFKKSALAYSSTEFLAKNAKDEVMPDRMFYLAEARLKQGIASSQGENRREAVRSLQEFLAEHRGDSRTDEALFWLGETYYRMEMFQNAQDNFHQLVEKHITSPRREEAMYGLGWSYFRQRGFSNSAKWFHQLVQEYPKTEFATEALARKGDGHYLLKEYSAAAESYRTASQQPGLSAESRYAAYQLGHAYRRLGRLDNAIEAFRQFVRKYPRSDNADYAFFSVGLIRFQEKKYNEAEREFRNFVATYPSSSLAPRAQYYIGDCQYNAGNFEQAIVEYRKVSDTYPSSPYSGEAIKSMTFCLESLGRGEEANKITDEFVANNPGLGVSEELTRMKAYKFYSGKRFGDAVSEYENYLKTYGSGDNAAEALFYLAKSYMSAGNDLKASQSISDLERKHPHSPYAHLGVLELGLMQLRMNRARTADSLFAVVQKRYADSSSAAQAGYERGRMALARNDTTSALAQFRITADKFAKTEFGDQSLYRIAMYWRSVAKYDTARAVLSVLADREDNPLLAAEAIYRIGELYMREKQYTGATAAFVRMRDSFSGMEDWYTLSLLGLAECYDIAGQLDKSRETYQAISLLRPNDDYGKAAQARLKRLQKSGNSAPTDGLPKEGGRQ